MSIHNIIDKISEKASSSVCFFNQNISNFAMLFLHNLFNETLVSAYVYKMIVNV